jgi:hypothetical protein
MAAHPLFPIGPPMEERVFKETNPTDIFRRQWLLRRALILTAKLV